MITDLNTHPSGLPMKLAVIRQLDVVLPETITPAFRYHDPDGSPISAVAVVGTRDGRTVRSVAIPPASAPTGTFLPHIDADRAEQWLDLPLALLDS